VGETLSPLQFSDHVDCDGAAFFKAAAELELEGIVSKRVRSLLRPTLCERSEDIQRKFGAAVLLQGGR